MKQQTNQLRRATGLLLAAAALPLTPLLAQETQAPAEPFAVEVPAPIATQPIETQVPAPQTTTPAPAAETATPTPAPQAATPRRTAPARAAARPAPRSAAPARAPAARAAPAPAASVAPAPAGDAIPLADAPAAGAPAEAAPVPVVLPPDAGAQPQQQQQNEGGSILPWLIGGALLLGALAFFMRRRRDADVHEERFVPAAAAAPVMAAPLADTPRGDAVDEHVEPIAAASVESGRPLLDFNMRPIRAGVTGEDAVVEFELSVDNQGSAAARDVRISTWMFAAGSERQTESERALIERGDESSERTIEAGGHERIERSVALPTSGIEDDAVLPVVVAEARYTLPDGSEGRSSASFAVGVPDGEELAHFGIENPSGFHEDVVARQLGEIERA